MGDSQPSYDEFVKWTSQALDMLGFADSALKSGSANNQESIADFVMGSGPKVLLVSQDTMSGGDLTLSCISTGSMPALNFNNVKAYVLRSQNKPLVAENLAAQIQYGTIGKTGLSLVALKTAMTGLVERQVSTNTELCGNYHRVMATLTDTVYSPDSMTVLYCPEFEVGGTAETPIVHKDHVQIMESIVIHWTSQIKDVVNSNDSSADMETSGPLEEIEFWKGRAKDLLGLQEQLGKANVKKIVDVLFHSKSNYIGPFRLLTEQIVNKAAQANDNLKYLESIREQCTALHTVDAPQISSVLPDLINRIRLIWSFSTFYQDNESMTGLLRKISNEIIQRFRAYIPVKEILNGNVELAISRLEEAIACGAEWKDLYHKTLHNINRQKSRYGGLTWKIEAASVFAQMDAFVQRCKDLIEVGESQMQFVRKSADTKGAPGPMPVFGGVKAQETTDGLTNIQVSFEQCVDKLRELTYDFLDVRISKWHDDYHHFKNVVKDLEVMYTNVINASFESATTVADNSHLVATFFWLAKSDSIKRAVEKKAMESMQKLLNQISSSRTEFESQRANPPLRLNEPQYAGSALWGHALLADIKEGYTALLSIKEIFGKAEMAELTAGYEVFANVIKDFKEARYKMWMEMLNDKAKDDGLQLRLQKNIMKRAEATPGAPARQSTELLCNFDEDLLALFSEVSFWEKFHGEFSIPYVAHDICNKREALRVMRETTLLVIRAYNDIIHDIHPDERRMFVDHLRRLDRRMNQGLNKLTWLSKNMIDMYVRDCLVSCQEVHEVVKDFKECKATIRRVCKSITSHSLVKIEKSVIYEGNLFETRQKAHLGGLRDSLESQYKAVLTRLRSSYKNFRECSAEVQREWRSQITQIDKDIEYSLKYSVKKSLQELSKAINGDSKTDPYTLFSAQIVLETGRVIYYPSMVSLTHTVNVIAKDIISVVMVVPRVRGQNFAVDDEPVDLSAASGEVKESELPKKKEDDKLRSYYEMIADDADILRIVVQIMNGMSGTATELQKYLSYWDKYKGLWEMDKDVYIRKYAKAHRSSNQFDLDITKYKAQQSEITGETSNHVINFVRVDCNVMKDALVSHCMGFQKKLTDLVHDTGVAELKSIMKLFTSSQDELVKLPKDLDELSNKIGLRKKLADSLEEVAVRFHPLREMYEVLSKFDVAVPDEETNQLNGINDSFADHKSMLVAAEKSLEKSKVSMKRNLEEQIEEYSTQMTEMRDLSKTELPYKSDVSMENAFKSIEKYKESIAKMKSEEERLGKGLSIFSTNITEHADLTALQKDIDFLDQIWTITQDWRANWETWKMGQFGELDVEDLENVAGTFTKRVGKLGRDIKKWRVWEAMKQELDKFRDTTPLIQDLRNKALRSRHWAALQERVGSEFNPADPSFTLNEVVKLGLDSHAEFIGELSSNANKELAIEVALGEIEVRWASVELDIGTYKDKYYKLRSTDDVSQLLEDDAVALSTMKASKFYASFQTKIDNWESTLSLISEIVEMILAVQRKWIYLESIFMSGGDIAKQLPKEYVLFVQVNESFLKVMTAFAETPNAKQTCSTPGLLDEINRMDEGLEKIQKSLDQYLETKRMVFPRFYFVSDDDLLEILGQSKDPPAVQKHIKKCFEGIKSIKLLPPGGGQRTYEASMMHSPDGEIAPFADNVVIDGAVELWLAQLEKAMVRSISKLLMQAVIGFKGKKEEWVKKTAGQLLITTGSIMWTTDCTRALTAIAAGSKGALKSQKKKQVSYLNKLTGIIRGPLSSVERNKVVALITMEIHNRDVMEKMVKANCSSVSDFEWLSQLRFVFQKEGGEFGKCECRQTNSVLEYSYEYQGNNGRLVVTPLTDRCVLTLITAMYLNRGGNPLGPAGTGKTETVKDLGKNLAKYVVVINCSDGMDYKSVGRIFSGLVQSGSWGCFDEFNRIKIEVISVVAMQILSILNALSNKVPSFVFMGQDIKCNLNCGIFITMNPGYAGRTELPDNLKALMRPVAMMAPDLTMIAEVMLASEGFNEARIMAKKTVTLYSLMVQQLSKQDHYDYGLRNLKAVLNMAGQLKRSGTDMPEESILMRALRDMNLPKFIKDDERLFRLLLGDLFPSVELPVSEYGQLAEAVTDELLKQNMQLQPFLMGKIYQFYDSRLTRHCNMLVGEPMGGKSTAWKTLAAAQSALQKKGADGFMGVTPFILSPKSIQLDELYGAYDLATFEWKDGILSTIFKSCSQDERPFEKWVLFDGPIDAMWIESMNSVMDDNRILTLINGDRIPLTSTMSLIFETQDLRVASPATVSRAGMIYIDSLELGWRTYTESWLARTFEDEEFKVFHRELFEKWVEKLLKFKDVQCREPVSVPDFVLVKNLCTLYDAMCKHENFTFKDKLGNEDAKPVIERIFLFCVVWSIGAAVDEKSRGKITAAFADIDAIFPAGGLVYDYFYDIPKNEFIAWDTKVPTFRATPTMTFHDMSVPTVDTVRMAFVSEALINTKNHVLFVGATGTYSVLLVFLPFLACDLSPSLLSICYCMSAFSDTWHESNHHLIPPSINHQCRNTRFTITILQVPARQSWPPPSSTTFRTPTPS